MCEYSMKVILFISTFVIKYIDENVFIELLICNPILLILYSQTDSLYKASKYSI